MCRQNSLLLYVRSVEKVYCIYLQYVVSHDESRLKTETFCRYCSYPQAVNIRMKCPVTCNVCTSNIDAVNEDVTNSFTGFPPSATPHAFQTASSMSKRNTQTFPVRPLPINLEEIRRRRPINVEAQSKCHYAMQCVSTTTFDWKFVVIGSF